MVPLVLIHQLPAQMAVRQQTLRIQPTTSMCVLQYDECFPLKEEGHTPSSKEATKSILPTYWNANTSNPWPTTKASYVTIVTRITCKLVLSLWHQHLTMSCSPKVPQQSHYSLEGGV